MVASLLKLIRWPNLLMIAFIQYLIRYSLIIPLNLPHALDEFYYGLGVLCSILLAAGGYIVNDIYDLETDAHNKPDRISIGKGISLNVAWNLYFISLLGATASAYFLSDFAGLDNLWLIAPLASILLYLYASDLKKRAVLGNLLVSFLSAMPVFLIAIFDIFPAATAENAEQVRQSFEVIIAYALFAFWTTLIRELIKDAEDRKGDRLSGYKTLAIIVSEKAFKVIVSALLLVLIGALTFYVNRTWPYDKTSSLYVILATILPSLYIFFKLWQAKESVHYKQLSTSLKLLMLLGILSMPFFTLSLIYQWL